ncbi:MAG: hypothetical protein J5956_13590 [Ruminococcus sp.]|nr:hypothetical protein [Ruminococcus sp.]
MKTEVKKRLATCILLWGAFVVIKWIMLLSPSSILSMLTPFATVFRDSRKDYVLSGWIGLSLETVLLGVLFLVRAKKIVPLYFVFIVYSAFYIPAVVYWIIMLEFEAWRYIQFLPAIACCVMMVFGAPAYISQVKLKNPGKKAPESKKSEDAEKEEKK